MSAIACPTCHQVIDDETDICPGCGKKFSTFRIRVICTHCEGEGCYFGDSDYPCHDCHGTGGYLSSDTNLKVCPNCRGVGFPSKDTGWLFTKMTRCECETCKGRGVVLIVSIRVI